MKTTTLGIDLAKNVFQVCALNRAGKVISNRAVKRAALTETVAQLQPRLIAMESCAGAHHWGRGIWGQESGVYHRNCIVAGPAFKVIRYLQAGVWPVSGSLDLEMPPPPLCIIRWVQRDGADHLF